VRLGCSRISTAAQSARESNTDADDRAAEPDDLWRPNHEVLHSVVQRDGGRRWARDVEVNFPA
jgi:hypothetical protein